MSGARSPASERTPLLQDVHAENGRLAEDGSLVENGAVPPETETEQGTPKARSARELIPIIIPMILGVFLVAMDTTVVTATYASIGSEFHQLQNSGWVATGYLLSMTSFQPLYGKLSDIFGRKACLLFAYTTFTLGCLCCGLARNMTELIAARALAGVGGGGLVTVSSIVMSDVATLRQRGTLQGIGNIAFAAGQATGAPLGGVLADTIGWRWAFLIQVPLAITAGLTVLFGLKLPRSPEGHFREKLARVDFLGALTLVLSIFSLLVGLDHGGNVRWADRLTIGCLTAFAVLFATFALVELRVAREPFAPKRIIANRTLLASYLCNLFSSGATLTLIFNVSMYLQAVQDASASQVGLVLLPAIAGGVIGSLASGLIMQATGRYYLLTNFAFGLLLAGTVTTALVTGPLTYKVGGVIAGTVLAQLGYGAGLTTTLIGLIANAGPEDQAIATAVSYLFRSLGTVVGLSLGTTLTQDMLRRSLRRSLSGGNVDEIVRRVRESLGYLKELEPELRATVVHAYQDGLQATFWFVVALAALASFSALFIKEKTLSK